MIEWLLPTVLVLTVVLGSGVSYALHVYKRRQDSPIVGKTPKHQGNAFEDLTVTQPPVIVEMEPRKSLFLYERGFPETEPKTLEDDDRGPDSAFVPSPTTVVPSTLLLGSGITDDALIPTSSIVQIDYHNEPALDNHPPKQNIGSEDEALAVTLVRMHSQSSRRSARSKRSVRTIPSALQTTTTLSQQPPPPSMDINATIMTGLVDGRGRPPQRSRSIKYRSPSEKSLASVATSANSKRRPLPGRVSSIGSKASRRSRAPSSTVVGLQQFGDPLPREYQALHRTMVPSAPPSIASTRSKKTKSSKTTATRPPAVVNDMSISTLNRRPSGRDLATSLKRQPSIRSLAPSTGYAPSLPRKHRRNNNQLAMTGTSAGQSLPHCSSSPSSSSSSSSTTRRDSRVCATETDRAMNLSSDQGLGTGDLESGRDFAYSEEEPAPDLEERFTFTAKNMFDFKVLAPPVTNEGLQHGDLEDDEEEDEEYGYTANRAPQHFDDQKDYYCPTPTATPPSGRSSDGKTRAAAIAFLKSSSSHRTSAMLNSNDSTSKGKFKTRMAPSSPETRTRREPRVSDGADADLSGITDDD